MAAVRQPTECLCAARRVRESLSAAGSVRPWARQGPLGPAAGEAAVAPTLARARPQGQASSSILRETDGRSPSHRFLSDPGELRTKMKEAHLLHASLRATQRSRTASLSNLVAWQR